MSAIFCGNQLLEGFRQLGSADDVVVAPSEVVVGHQRCHGHHDFLTDDYGGSP